MGDLVTPKRDRAAYFRDYRKRQRLAATGVNEAIAAVADAKAVVTVTQTRLTALQAENERLRRENESLRLRLSLIEGNEP